MPPIATGDSGKSFYSIFSKVEKFDGKGDVDLSSWLRSFDRCCTISQKDDDLIQGQLLMLCLAGQALAVAEHLEEEKKTQQKYSEIKVRLESVFKTAAIKEVKMGEFENRIQRLDESEDEFMLSLIKLYRAADPDGSDTIVTKAIKRRFMGGISSEVRQSIYIFIYDPHASTATYQNLLEYSRKAKIHALESNTNRHPINALCTSSNSDNSNEKTFNDNYHILKAISDLNENVNKRIDNLENDYNNRLQGINVISRGRNNYRSNRNRYSNSRGNFSNRNARENKNFNDEPSGNNFRCFKCNGLNHFAKECPSKNV